LKSRKDRHRSIVADNLSTIEAVKDGLAALRPEWSYEICERGIAQTSGSAQVPSIEETIPDRNDQCNPLGCKETRANRGKLECPQQPPGPLLPQAAIK
jgi:hypothetical protein